ncbi:MAG TPA: dienelactone hydrolase family protein [Tepidisphaeraceae bacterium]|jgi:dienelactone hydrolase|nr:dienelactone hydrolase family protein [Tepidisphaeraceae bacterium]
MMNTLLVVILALACIAATRSFSELREPPSPAVAPITTLLPKTLDRESWSTQRETIRRQWLDILGPMPQRVGLNVQEISREELPDHVRVLIRYQNDAASTNEAYVLIPKNAAGKLPAMVCLHPTSKTTIADPVGLANRESVHHALHLVRRGYICIAPRNYLWDVAGRSYQKSADDLLAGGKWKTGMAKMLWDAERAVDVLVARDDVDPKRIGAIGHSLGGKETLYLAGFDERITAAISCEGGVGLSMGNWDADWYLGKQIQSPAFHHDNDEVLSLVAPRAILIIGGESADGVKSWPYVDACLPLWKMFGAEDRIGLLRHDLGHEFPHPGPQRDLAYNWLDHWLK